MSVPDVRYLRPRIHNLRKAQQIMSHGYGQQMAQLRVGILAESYSSGNCPREDGPASRSAMFDHHCTCVVVTLERRTRMSELGGGGT